MFLFLSVHQSELQAAVRVHRYPASFAEHSEGFLEAGSGLSLHVYRHAERRGSRSGESDDVDDKTAACIPENTACDSKASEFLRRVLAGLRRALLRSEGSWAVRKYSDRMINNER